MIEGESNMILNFEQLKAITKGATRVEMCDGAYRFFRFTEAQTEVYREQAEKDPSTKHFYDKSFATAGVITPRSSAMNFKSLNQPVSLPTRSIPGPGRHLPSFAVLASAGTDQ